MKKLPQGIDKAVLLAHAERGLARKSFPDFCAYTDPQFVLPRHTKAICERLEALERRDIDKLILAVQPRVGKTYLTSERFPAWWIGRNPAETVVLASYGQELAERNSRKARAIVASDRWPFETSLTTDTTAMNRWNVNGGGGLIAAGVGSALSGMPADCLIIDDPVKDRAEAESATVREATWSWYQDVARTRLMPRGVQLIIQTRWQEDDLVGRLLNSRGASKWSTLILPALAEENDPIGRAVGEELWPERGIPLPSVELGEISSRSWAALYMQNPSPAEGRTFKAAWMEQRYTSLPDDLRLVMAVDGAWSKSISADFSVIAVWGGSRSHYYLVDLWRQRAEFPVLKAAVLAMYDRYRPGKVIVEAAASGYAVVQALQTETRLPVIGVPARASKESRAEAVTALFESGRVVLPASAPWLDIWLDEHLRFPGGGAGVHDDTVDTTSLALSELSKRKAVFAMSFDDNGLCFDSAAESERERLVAEGTEPPQRAMIGYDGWPSGVR